MNREDYVLSLSVVPGLVQRAWHGAREATASAVRSQAYGQAVEKAWRGMPMLIEADPEMVAEAVTR